MLRPVQAIRSFPWQAIDRVPREALGAVRAVREALDGCWGPESIAHALADVLGEPAEIVSTQVTTTLELPSSRPHAACLFESTDGATRVLVEIEPELAAHAVARVLGRPAALIDRNRSVPPSVEGAVSGLALAVARRAAVRDALVLTAIGSSARTAFARSERSTIVVLAVTVVLGGEAFRVMLSVLPAPVPTRRDTPFGVAELRELGDVRLALPVVAAVCGIDADAIESMMLGDVFLPSEGWTIRRVPHGVYGDVMICAPGGTSGLRANLRDDGEIVLREGAMSVDIDADQTEPSPALHVIETPAGATMLDALADAPLVVRVELGAVTLTAKEWAALRPGDVLTTGRRIAERATLRIAGREVARGELVDIDGELGVRIHDLVRNRNGVTP